MNTTHPVRARRLSDLGLGVRLAVGGGRPAKAGLARLALGTIGIGLAVAVLLLAASVGTAMQARHDRQLGQAGQSMPIAGVDPLYLHDDYNRFRGETVKLEYVRASGPHAPLPPGVSRIPAPGEVVLSPNLAELLGSPDGELLRPRVPGKVIGTIGRPGLVDPFDLVAYLGADTSLNTGATYGFGLRPMPWEPLPPNLFVLLLVGVVALLTPIFAFVMTSARIAGAERDRRLAAIRLVGADARQARRIAAAESLASAVTGLLFGTGLFLVARQFAPGVQLQGISVFPGDLVPPWPLAALIVAGIPVLAVVTALFALRRTVIEPLGVVRRGRPIRRRLWWRLLPIVAGVLVMLTLRLERGPGLTEAGIAAGVVLLLLGVPALLPWLLERAVSRIHGGRPALQLAVRRLQSDSGTPARVVAGLAVMLAGAIALQSLLVGQAARYAVDETDLASPYSLGMSSEPETAEAAIAALRALPGIAQASLVRSVLVTEQDADSARQVVTSISVADCATLATMVRVRDCADGDVFAPAGAPSVRTGQNYQLSTVDRDGGTNVLGAWRVPAVQPVTRISIGAVIEGSLLVTPGALTGIDVSGVRATGLVAADSADPDFAEHVRNTLAPFTWHAAVQVQDLGESTQEQRTYLAIRKGLLGGSVFILLLAGVSLLVLALEHLRERRRSIAVLSATGVPMGVLARSLLWQNAIPLVLGIAVAMATGLSLATLTFRMLGLPPAVDWAGVGLLCGATAAALLLVTALTLPTLRGATRLTALRTE